MATGAVTFRGDTSATIFDGILNRLPSPPLRLNPDLPPKLEDIINKSLEKDRSLRYQHAADIRIDLQRAQSINYRLDGGIPQAEACGAHERGPGAGSVTFYRGCTRSGTLNHAKTRPSNGISKCKAETARCSQQDENCVTTSAAIPSRAPRFPGVPLLLQLWLQFTRNTVQLLSKSSEMRARPCIHLLRAYFSSCSSSSSRVPDACESWSRCQKS